MLFLFRPIGQCHTLSTPKCVICRDNENRRRRDNIFFLLPFLSLTFLLLFSNRGLVLRTPTILSYHTATAQWNAGRNAYFYFAERTRDMQRAGTENRPLYMAGRNSRSITIPYPVFLSSSFLSFPPIFLPSMKGKKIPGVTREPNRGVDLMYHIRGGSSSSSVPSPLFTSGEAVRS